LDRKGIAILLASIIMLSSILLPGAGAEAEHSITIRVVDPSGTPLRNMDVYLIRGAEVRRFITNSTGYAEFRHLEEGEYVAEVRLGNITLAKRAIKVPEEVVVELTAPISTRIELRFLNLDGRPVKDLSIMLESGGYSASGRTNVNGVAVFERIPYSGLEGVGVYRLTASLGDVKLLDHRIMVDKPEISEEFSLPLLDLRLTIVNLEGEPVAGASVRLASRGYSASRVAENGTAYFENVPSSAVVGVGAYNITASISLGRRMVKVVSDVRDLTSSQSLSLIADLAELRVRVVDEDGEPLAGIQVMLSNELAANFTSASTGSDGVAIFRNMPLSRGAAGAGVYVIRALRAGTSIGEASHELVRSGEVVEVRARRSEVRFRLVDYEGRPLAGYNLTLIDDLTNRGVMAVTDELGEAAFRIFYGPYGVRISKGGRVIYTGSIRILQGEVMMRLDRVNFPLVIDVRDAFGRPVRSAEARISLADEIIFHDKLTGEPLPLKMPYPAELRCDIYDSSGRLVHREVVVADAPGSRVIRLMDYVEAAGLVPLEAVALGLIMLIAAILLASGTILLVRGIRRKRLITSG